MDSIGVLVIVKLSAKRNSMWGEVEMAPLTACLGLG